MTAVPKTVNQKEAQKLLESVGYTRQKGGKHVVKMVKRGKPPVTLPMHKGQQYSVGLTRSILKQAGIT